MVMYESFSEDVCSLTGAILGQYMFYNARWAKHESEALAHIYGTVHIHCTMPRAGSAVCYSYMWPPPGFLSLHILTVVDDSDDDADNDKN